MLSFPLKEGDEYFDETNFYINVPKTGVFLAKKYTSKGTEADSITVNVKIGEKEMVSVKAGAFECYKITTILESHTGSFITAATTTITMERWWSPELGYFVKELSTVYMDALTNYKGTIEKELLEYNLAG